MGEKVVILADENFNKNFKILFCKHVIDWCGETTILVEILKLEQVKRR